ncbi:MAG: tetratricopeptide repeat protein [Acidobacteriota bacterium]|nr:tetratricopeptide repeat protein [Acidobacteriota bacterium]
MVQPKSLTIVVRFGALLLWLCAGCYSPAVQAQTADQNGELRRQAVTLMEQVRYTQALPLLEKLVAAQPDDAQIQFYLGFALNGQAYNTKDDAARRTLRIRAREALVKAKKLGTSETIVDALIQSLPVDGRDAPMFSSDLRAHALMVEAEGLFAQGKLDDALKNYQGALERDPKLYHAALFSGDVFMQRGDFAQAEIWYQKAIAIDPNKETAYRYSATPLMKQGKTDAARDRYVEAYISEPYNPFSQAGLNQWARITGTAIDHLRIDIPTEVTFDEKGDAKINLDAGALLSGKDDGSFAWISYGATRSTWRKEKFARTSPNEKVYRHSLAEEADALRSVVSIATADKKATNLNPSLVKLKKLDDEGLLEAYIVLARPDEGIAVDHAAYLRAARDKLRRYVVKYILTGGGN